ncbi:hypothetical protein QUF58_07815 [Anaerolineales bacterium HSG24]|nr:hypothetical protein [Anaerolineales bacterium HSG24]
MGIIMDEEQILPVEEMVAYEEFTGRVEILRKLNNWVKNIQKTGTWSTALISPRRMGKTVLLDRLVNTVFFKPEYRVAPFYFRIRREETTLRRFLLEYATTFFRQYIAYCHQDPILYQNHTVELKDLLAYQSEHKAVLLAQKFMQEFVKRYERNTYEDSRNHWDAFIRVPEQLASFSGTRVAVIIDEFQDMKFYIHDGDQQTVERFIEKRSHDSGVEGTDLTATYDRQSQSRKAPMLVSGSAVTLIFKTVMGGPLAGRFDPIYLKPLAIPDGAILLRHLLRLYVGNTPISPENAIYASSEVTGHPYYLFCLATSQIDSKTFEDKESIDRIIRHEIENVYGKIHGFWQTHFENNRRYINADSDEEVGKKIIYYFTQYNNKPVDIKEIAGKLKIPEKTVEQKIQKLRLADLVYLGMPRYYTFNDICLMRFIRFTYEKDWEDVEKVARSYDKKFNSLKGKFLEMVVELTMRKFSPRKLDGKYFGVSGEVEVPLFEAVDTMQVKGLSTRAYQIDVWGKLPRKKEYWFCECKYTKKPMYLDQVKKFEAAAATFRQQEAEAGRAIPQLRLWLVSTGGFAGEVLEYIKNREEIYFSDHDGINQIFKAFGGNYGIPIFNE